MFREFVGDGFFDAPRMGEDVALVELEEGIEFLRQSRM